MMVEGAGLRALVVGGGSVGSRKARALIESGAHVRVVSPQMDESLRGSAGPHLELVEREYAPGDIADAVIVVAATSSRQVNARVTADARALARLVNVADIPAEGNFVTPALHRAGDLVIAVAAGGVPAAAARIRDAIATRYAEPYARALADLAALRAGLLSSGERARWARVADEAIGPDFCDVVERGEFPARAAAWR